MKEFLKKIKAKHVIWLAVSVVLLVIAIVVTCVAVYWDTVLVGFFGTVGEGGSGSATNDDGTAVDTQYFKSNYLKSDGTVDEDALLKDQEQLNLEIAEEGAVLLENKDSALPLNTSTESSVSVFSVSSRSWITGGSGSGSVSTGYGQAATVKSSLEDAGFTVNPDLWSFYGSMMAKYGLGSGTLAGSGTEIGDWSIGEVPQSEYTQTVKDSYSSYGDAAIVIISRNSGEGGDLPRDMTYYDESNNGHYLELDQNEKDMLTAIQNAGFGKTIVVINSANAFQVDFVDDYDVDAVLWLAGTGTNGLEALGEILAGKVNPSGKLADTYVYDNFSAPAMQNFGCNIYTDGSGNNTDYNFVNYAEGIYVDYKYYETRYEDTVLSTSNVGSYDYAETVYRPFGYGDSYTTFDFSNYSLTLADGTAITTATEITADTELKASVTVTNTGLMAGKTVAEFYYQSPYTEYDKTYGIEKSSAELVGFAKTDTLAAASSEGGTDGGSQTLSTTFKVSDMKSYDATQAKTYILEPGTYYVTAATDSHQAVNNILLAKSSDYESSLSGTGDADLAASITISGTPSEPIQVSTSAGGLEVTNEFDGSSASDATYLSRSNWAVLDTAITTTRGVISGGISYATGTTTFTSSDNVPNVVGGAKQISTATESALAAAGWDNSGRPSEKNDNSDALYSQDGSYTYTDENGAKQTVTLDLTYMIGADYDDERWDTLIEMAKISELHTLFNKAGYMTQAMESINKPRTYDYDGPSGVTNYLNGEGGYGYCTEVVIASTWNVELAERFGLLIGEDGLLSNTSGWYAPAMNIHRTPFAGRNFEYYSADGYLSGAIAVKVVQGAQSMGMYTYIKHFALNDQESNRKDVATWAQEQAIRETYLKPFEMAVEEGGSKAVMSAMNRIGAIRARGNYNLLTNVLRGEWGFTGFVITDYLESDTSDADQILSAGGDCILNTSGSGCPLSDTHENYVRHALQDAAHNILYVVANSAAMNGLAPGIKYSSGFAIYNFIIIAIWVVFAAVIVVWGVLIFKKKKTTAAGTDASADGTDAASQQ